MYKAVICIQAVLLLRPSVPLYSTDAMPINCSAHTTTAEQQAASSAQAAAAPPAVTRTCECLTQTLCCHGCGTPVGYMIVIPVRRPRPLPTHTY